MRLNYSLSYLFILLALWIGAIYTADKAIASNSKNITLQKSDSANPTSLEATESDSPASIDLAMTHELILDSDGDGHASPGDTVRCYTIALSNTAPVTLTALTLELNEAPMLAEMVAAGDFPPLEERLPPIENLLVIEPVHEIGKYGGTWRRSFLGPADGQNGHRVAGEDRFVFWNSENFREVVPNLAKSWEVNDGGREIIIHLREGVKWSDGEPLTSADVMFWFENMYKNEELVPVRSPFFNIDEGANLEAIDDFTLRFTFEFKNSLFLEMLGSSVNVFGGHAIFDGSGFGCYAPEHYNIIILR